MSGNVKFRDPELAKTVAEKIKALAPKKGTIKFCHVCGTHEWTITHYGLRSLLPGNVEVIAGPGCPVCIVPAAEIDEAVQLARKGVVVSYESETPFDSLEGSHEYIALLAEAIAEARRDVEADVAAAESEGAERRKQALLLVSYNLAKLNLHITNSRRILNDLRSLRRLLLSERGKQPEEVRRRAASAD